VSNLSPYDWEKFSNVKPAPSDHRQTLVSETELEHLGKIDWQHIIKHAIVCAALLGFAVFLLGIKA
jgi:hypothetical protein